ncbi:lipase family protein [Paremcibacter congregatus]|uniref:lipase family protein n=1 Tax=Paremcibacter congregatus TaxID=2043170 RepID=UPI003A903B5E
MKYDPQLALVCAELSAAIYFPDAEANATGCPDTHYVDIAGTQALILNRPDSILVVFRGTTYEDIPSDFKCRMKRADFGYVHRGFLAYAKHAFYDIEDCLDNWGPKPLIFTGHSLGAAAAVNAAAVFANKGYEIAAVYTFGCPRVGNGDFCEYAAAAVGDVHFRHVNGHDGVPMLPPWLLGYQHCGKLVYFSMQGQKRFLTMSPLMVLLERLPLLLTKPWKWAQSKRVDHAVFLYESACQRNLEEPPECEVVI